MVDTMNREERISHGSVFGEEGPTRVAELSIRLVPQDTRNQQFERSGSFGLRFSKGRIDVASVRARISVAIEAEAAAIPDVGAEIIDEELSRIMSPRPAVGDPSARRLERRAYWNRRPTLVQVLQGSGVMVTPDAQEPTAAAELHITLVHY